MKKKILYLLSHPIQYQSPLIESISKDRFIDLEVIYYSDYSVKKHFDKAFGKKIRFNVPLLKGYKYSYIFKGDSKNIFIFLFKIILIFKKKKPDFLWVHGYDTFYKIITIFLANFFNCKVLLRGESNLLKNNFITFYIYTRKLFFFFLDYFVDIYMSIGRKNKEFYENFVSKNKIYPFPYVVNNNFFEKKILNKKNKIKLLNTLNIKKNSTIFIYTGKIIRKKNLSFLLEIFSKLVNKYNNIYLLIVGDGEERSFLEKKYNNFSKNIKFLGFANQKEISNFYSISNIFIMPSSYEPWGLSVNEAMIFQNALLLSSNVGSGYDLLKHNKNGFFFKNNCSHDLESKIQKLLSNKKKLTKMQKESKKIISKWSINYSKNYFMNIINSF
jgi:glycosyltransferase involved in cell wall biosynthesis